MQHDNVNIVTASSKMSGEVEFAGYTRFEGRLTGTLRGVKGSEIVLCSEGVVEGDIVGDTVIVDGFVRGSIKASSRVVVSETGRVIGEITSPSVSIAFGGYFEGDCSMESALDLA